MHLPFRVKILKVHSPVYWVMKAVVKSWNSVQMLKTWALETMLFHFIFPSVGSVNIVIQLKPIYANRLQELFGEL